MQFNDLPVADGTKDAVAAMGYEEATPIQRDAIPHLLKGRDLIGRARTGTGKTAAFGIPLVDKLRDAKPGVRALVLCPTRELALQVAGVLSDLASGSSLRIVPVYGGAGFGAQTEGLRRRAPIIVVACPGRLLDLVERGVADLRETEVLILDEADRMLDMGFIHDMRRILRLLPDERQTSLWSATFEGEVRRLSKEFLWDPVTVEMEDEALATPLTEQFQVRVEKSDKQQALLALLHRDQPPKALVFTRTKHLAKRMAGRLNDNGWAAVALQGNMSQSQRERAMETFRQGKARILVATDVAARGLDVPDITHVVNYDIPVEKEAYVHRIGRTGRNGATGRSYTFVQGDEVRDMQAIERLAGASVPAHTVGQAFERGPDAPVPQVHDRPHGGGGGRGRGRRGPSNGPRHGGASRNGPRSFQRTGRSNHRARRY